MDILAILRDVLADFETSAARGLSVLDVTGTDVAAFCDRQLVGATPYLDKWRSSLNRGVAEKLLD
jgi:DNA-binding ferritin-like protein (Dps family)